jgi:hypothetical protein
MRNRIVSIVPLPEHQPIPLMAYEHVKQCLQVAQGRLRADSAIITLFDRYERDRRRALAFVKGGFVSDDWPVVRVGIRRRASESRLQRDNL